MSFLFLGRRVGFRAGSRGVRRVVEGFCFVVVGFDMFVVW